MNPGKETPPQILPENFNNFYEYLPGGMHRSDGKYWSEEKQKVIDDLDKIAKDLNIDIDSISREAHLGEDLMDGTPRLSVQI